ncbi:MAG: branched-chain amino acid ABC transporter substrate-binding protein [Rhizobiaceae bacterium]
MTLVVAGPLPRSVPATGANMNMEIALPVNTVAALLLAISALLFSPAVSFADGPVVGIVTPLSGPNSRLGEQLGIGAEKAFERSGMQTILSDDACSAEGGEKTARQLASAGVSLVIGYLCTASVEHALPILSEAGIPVITPGVRTDSITDRRSRTGWLVYRLAPRADAERKAIADIFIEQWADKFFAIVDDGTIYGRELAESFRLSVEQEGLKPVFTDTYRPQFDNQIGLAGRLKNAGATHVFVGGNRDDVAILARDAGVIEYPLVIAAGETLRAARGEVDLAPGTLMIGLPEASDIATTSVLQSFQSDGVVPEGYVLGGYLAGEIAVKALQIKQQSQRSLTEILSGELFETSAGKIRFNESGDRTDNPYRLFRYDGENFVEVR